MFEQSYPVENCVSKLSDLFSEETDEIWDYVDSWFDFPSDK